VIQVTTLDRRQCETATCSRAGTVHLNGLELVNGLDLCRRCARILASRILAALATEAE